MPEKDWFFSPREYLRFGDKPIVSKPLINTSLKELADAEWYLAVYARYVKGYGHTKVKYHFSDPDKNGNPFIVFRLWVAGNLTLEADGAPLLATLVVRDLTPNFSRPPSFALMPLADPQYLVQAPLKKEETELEYLERTNAEKLKNLKARVRHETPSQDRDVISPSERRLVG